MLVIYYLFSRLEWRSGPSTLAYRHFHQANIVVPPCARVFPSQFGSFHPFPRFLFNAVGEDHGTAQAENVLTRQDILTRFPMLPCGLPNLTIIQHALLGYIFISNIITDAVLMTIPVAVVWPLHMARRSRLAIISFFWSRVLFVKPLFLGRTIESC